MSKNATNRFHFFSTAQAPPTDPGPVALAYAWASPLAKVLLALLSSTLLICSLPDPDIGWLAWVALVPLIIACDGLRPLHAAGLGLASGIVASFGIYGWLFEVPSFDMRHAILLALYVAAYPAAWCAATAWMTQRQIPLILTAPALWVAIDYLRAHAGFLALSWGTLAQSQHLNLAILQFASFGGEQAVTFLVALGNAAIAALILRRERQEAVVAVVVLLIAHLWGAAVLHSTPSGQTIKVAAIQPNIPVAELKTEEGRRASMMRLEQLTRKASVMHPALIAWPETSVIGSMRGNPFLAADLQLLVQTIATPLVLGVSELEKFSSRDGQGAPRRHAYNSAYLVAPNTPLSSPYHKRVLLPFGEYVPLESFVTWPAWIGGRGYDRATGGGADLFTIPDGISFATLICWESLFSDLSRESVAGGARLIVQLNNPAWFGRTAAGKQQNLSSVLRAVENRVPVLLASNTGPSQIIDAFGRVVAGGSTSFAADVIVGDVRIGSGGTFYTRNGDLSVLIIAGSLLGLGLRLAFKVRQRSHGATVTETDGRAAGTSNGKTGQLGLTCEHQK